MQAFLTCDIPSFLEEINFPQARTEQTLLRVTRSRKQLRKKTGTVLLYTENVQGMRGAQTLFTLPLLQRRKKSLPAESYEYSP